MRIALSFLFACLATLGVQAQQITGTTNDADGAPVKGATVSLLKDSAVVKLAVTKEAGTYAFTGMG